EVICTLRGLEDFGAGFEGAHETRDGPFGDFAQKGFELGEGFSMGFLEINRFGNPPTDSTRSDTALFQGAVPAPQEPSRRAESFLRGRRVVADRDLSHAQGRYEVPGSRKG